MVRINDKEKCCGCAACVQACPKQCISFEEDSEGFRYPIVDERECVECGLCEKKCPILNQYPRREPLSVYAACNLDGNIRSKSSSGGLFTLFAQSIIAKGGRVYGAKFTKEWMVIHDHADNIADCAQFRGSKYVQSLINKEYKDCKEYLNTGHPVLFSGTPCQIAGLYRFLGSDYSNLYTVDILCHGVPSPKVWRVYLNEEVGDKKIQTINFRSKKCGWENYSMEIISSGVKLRENHSSNLFQYGAMKGYYIRPSCHNCQFRYNKSNSDISIGDYWGIGEKDIRFADDKGTSMVLINTSKGESLFSDLSLKCSLKSYRDAIETCTMLIRSAKGHINRAEFFNYLNATNKVKPFLKKEMIKNNKRSILRDFLRKYLKIRILIDQPGQTCNRFWSYLDSLGYVIENNSKLVILFWDKDIKYYKNFLDSKYIILPFRHKIFTVFFKEESLQYLVERFICQSFIGNLLCTIIPRRWQVREGWQLRDNFEYFPKHISTIREIFKPELPICQKLDTYFENLKKEGYFVVGVHIRRGDYKTFFDGRYYFEDQLFIDLMQRVCNLYNDKKVIFFISTNEKIDKDIFGDLELCNYQSESAAEDLYALTKCDRIFGPLSTFSRWASLMGNVPLYFMERSNEKLTDDNFSIIRSFYKFENGHEIANLTEEKTKLRKDANRNKNTSSTH